MIRTLYTGRSGMNAYQEQIDLVSNNISNTSTSGYKTIKTNFDELLRDELMPLGTPLSDTIEEKNPTMGTGVKKGTDYRVFDQGVLQPSANSMELALEGEGFFGYRDLENNLMLSRTANIYINEQGVIVNEKGHLLETYNQEDLTQYDPSEITIALDGRIMTMENGEDVELGRVVIYDVAVPNHLMSVGGNYYAPTEGQELYDNIMNGEEREFGEIRQGFFEGSNVDLGDEMVDMIIAQRAYQFSSRSVQAADEMWQVANNLKG